MCFDFVEYYSCVLLVYLALALCTIRRPDEQDRPGHKCRGLTIRPLGEDAWSTEKSRETANAFRSNGEPITRRTGRPFLPPFGSYALLGGPVRPSGSGRVPLNRRPWPICICPGKDCGLFTASIYSVRANVSCISPRIEWHKSQRVISTNEICLLAYGKPHDFCKTESPASPTSY